MQQSLATTKSTISREQDTSSSVLMGNAEPMSGTSSFSFEGVHTAPSTTQSIGVQVKPLHRNVRIQATPITSKLSKEKGTLVASFVLNITQCLMHTQLSKQLQ